MEGKPDDQPTPTANPADAPKINESPPAKEPEKAAGSINPQAKAPFYEAVIQKGSNRKRR